MRQLPKYGYGVVFIIFSFLFKPVYANVGLALSVGEGVGVEGVSGFRTAIAWDFGPLLFKEKSWGLHTHWESVFGYWYGKRTVIRQNDNLDFVGLGPVFRWQKNEPFKQLAAPYLEVGIGASWLSQREIGGRILSTHFQFEDKMGVGCRFGRGQHYDLIYRFIHYSNGTIKRPNSGVNLQMISVGLWFN